MVKKNLVERVGDKTYSKEIEVFDNPLSLSKALSPGSVKILKELSKNPSYPASLAKKLRLHEQKVYYHVRNLLKAGLIQVVREEWKQGAICKYYAPTSDSFGFELSSKKKTSSTDFEVFPELTSFFKEFITGTEFNGLFVVGAPSEHGPYLTIARDGHLSTRIAFFLGSLSSLPKNSFVRLDTEVKAEKLEKNNLVVFGGPVTNMLSNELNRDLKVRLEWNGSWRVKSSFTNKVYYNDTTGLIAKVKNPFDENKKVILIAGNKLEGTRAALIALTDYYSKTLKYHDSNKEFYAVIEGLDVDGDGKVDDVKVLECFPGKSKLVEEVLPEKKEVTGPYR